MKTYTKATIVIGIMLGLISILRETDVLDFYLLKSNVKVNIHTDWKNNTGTITTILAPLRIEGKRLPSEAPINVKIDDEIVYKIGGKGDTLTINVAGLSTLFAWVPLYKASEFKTKATVNYHLHGFKTDGVFYDGEPAISQINGTVTGTIDITGNVTIKGICSHNEAKQILGEEIAKRLVDVVEQNLVSMDNNL
ncbi:hypothetical protein [Flavobacterium psychrotrophum]|uniref:hypothetical protein n=1 Tax=Flavobacterium psychrotrophum TaxID=2294119 RepID=UPI0013C48F44|nr:hypothetical protein [Flavobacterium psychrotrophum]